MSGNAFGRFTWVFPLAIDGGTLGVASLIRIFVIKVWFYVLAFRRTSDLGLFVSVRSKLVFLVIIYLDLVIGEDRCRGFVEVDGIHE
jgi:hypothetical protein